MSNLPPLPPAGCAWRAPWVYERLSDGKRINLYREPNGHHVMQGDAGFMGTANVSVSLDGFGNCRLISVGHDVAHLHLLDDEALSALKTHHEGMLAKCHGALLDRAKAYQEACHE